MERARRPSDGIDLSIKPGYLARILKTTPGYAGLFWRQDLLIPILEGKVQIATADKCPSTLSRRNLGGNIIPGVRILFQKVAGEPTDSGEQYDTIQYLGYVKEGTKAFEDVGCEGK